jgi:autotransporter-associated beta strand protein
VDLVLTGTLTLGQGSGPSTRSLTQNNTTGLLIVNGAIVDGVGSGPAILNKLGSGPLVLQGANTYTGLTQIAAGAIVVNSDTAIPAASQIVFTGGNLGFWNAVPVQPVYRYIVPGTAPVPTLTTSRNYIFNGNGTFDIGAGLALTQAASSVFSGQGILQKSGMGTMILNGLNPVAATSVLGGVLSVSNNAQLGDTVANGAVTLNSSSASAPATLFVTNSFATARALTFTANGALDVAAGPPLHARRPEGKCTPRHRCPHKRRLVVAQSGFHQIQQTRGRTETDQAPGRGG